MCEAAGFVFTPMVLEAHGGGSSPLVRSAWIGWPGDTLPVKTRILQVSRSELLSAYRVHSSGRTRVQFCSERSGLQRLPIRPADGKSSHCRCSLPNCPMEALS